MSLQRLLRTLAVALLLVPVALTGCKGKTDKDGKTSGDSGSTSSDTINIAVAGPMTGSAAAFGEMIRMAAELREKEINDAGGIGGKKVKLVIQDDRGLAQEATSVSRKVGTDQNICAVVGHFNSDCSLAAKPNYKRYELLSISPGSTNVDVCQGSDWFFRNLYRDDQQGTFLARFAQKALGLKKVAIVFESDNYGTGLKDAFLTEAKNLGLEIVATETYQRGRTQDFRPHMTKVKNSGADGVFISGLFNEAALILKTARNDLGMKVPFFGGDGLSSPDLIKTGGAAAEGCYVTTPFLFGVKGQSEDVAKFVAAFEKMHSKKPDTWAALTYDALGQVFAAIKAVGADRKKIRDHLAAQTDKDKGFSGITGVTYFDKNGDCVGKPIYVSVVKDKQFANSDKQLLD